MHNKEDKLTKKETIQYSVAIGVLISGVIMCFLSFFLNQYQVHDSVLWYFGETCALAGTLMGFNVFVKNELNAFQGKVDNLEHRMRKVDNLIKD